jgi:hypothetical protein
MDNIVNYVIYEEIHGQLHLVSAAQRKLDEVGHEKSKVLDYKR